MVTLTRPESGEGSSSREIFYCARPSCSALCYSKAELERHALTAHTEIGQAEKIEDEFSFDSDNEEEEQDSKQTGRSMKEADKAFYNDVYHRVAPIKEEGEKKIPTVPPKNAKKIERKLETRKRKPYKKGVKDETSILQ